MNAILRSILKQSFFLPFLLIYNIGFSQQQVWNPVNSGTSKNLLSISFGSTLTGYIGGVDSLLLKTIDGGQTWNPIGLTGIIMQTGLNGQPVNDLVAVDFVSDSVGYIALSDREMPFQLASVYKTSDGGNSWLQITLGNPAALNCFFFSDGEGFIIGSDVYLGEVVGKFSSDVPVPGGYHSFSWAAGEFLRAIDFRTTSIGIVGGEHGRMYRTFNGGISWDTVQTHVDSIIFSLKFLDDNTIMAAVNDGVNTLLISEDTGRTWKTDYHSFTFITPTMKSVTSSRKDSFISVGASFAFGNIGEIYWHDRSFMAFQTVAQPLVYVATRDDSVAFAVGDSGLIVTNIIPASTSIPKTKGFDENLRVYPNPAGNYCITELKEPHGVVLYDIMGKSVYESQTVGMKQYINLSTLTRGIYVIAVEVKGERVFRKLILE